MTTETVISQLRNTDLGNSNPVFSVRVTLWLMVLPHHVWLQKVWWFGNYCPDKQLKFRTLAATLTLNTAVQSFHKTLKTYDVLKHN